MNKMTQVKRMVLKSRCQEIVVVLENKQETTNDSVSQTSPATSIDGGAEQGNASGTYSGAAPDTEDANETSEATPFGAYLAPSTTGPRKKKGHDVVEAVSMLGTSSRRYSVLMVIALCLFFGIILGLLFLIRSSTESQNLRISATPSTSPTISAAPEALLRPIWKLRRFLPMLPHPPISPW
jgi:hypothetical protein